MSDVKKVPLFTKMPPVIFNVGLFLGKRYWGYVKRLFCVSASTNDYVFYVTINHNENNLKI